MGKNELSGRRAYLCTSAVLLLFACGGGGGGGGGGTGGRLELLAGEPNGAGSVDGTLAAARFAAPRSLAIDGAGNIFIADFRNATIRKISPGGIVSTFAGTPGFFGSADGNGAAALFDSPVGVTTDSAGNLYVADAVKSTIRKITSSGEVTTFAGTAGARGSVDGTGAAVRFNSPVGVATDAAGNVYVADSENETIRKITPAGVVSTFAGMVGIPGNIDGTGTAASLQNPTGIVADSAGNLYVTCSSNIRKITPQGVVTTLAGSQTTGSADGAGSNAGFNFPGGIAVDGAGNVYVADSGNDTIRKVTSAGVVSTLAGSAGSSGSADGNGTAARFNFSMGVTTDSAGNVYVADSGNDTIRKITPSGAVSTFAGRAGAVGSADGSGAAAGFDTPSGIAVDSAGDIYVADSSNHTIRKVTDSGVVSTFAGMAGVFGSADGDGPAATFSNPVDVAVDPAGNVYVLEVFSPNIRKITPAGVVSTLTTGLTFPFGVAPDAAGNLYVADASDQTIRKVTPAGVVSLLAGQAGIAGSADGTTATFKNPAGVATDSAGNVYVADASNHAIRKITPAGVVSTLAGTAGVPGRVDGIGTAAQFNFPNSVAVDSTGNVYVADFGNSTIRKIAPGGAVSTIVGVLGQGGFTPGELPGLVSFPNRIAVRGSSLYLTMNNGVVVVRNRP